MPMLRSFDISHADSGATQQGEEQLSANQAAEVLATFDALLSRREAGGGAAAVGGGRAANEGIKIAPLGPSGVTPAGCLKHLLASSHTRMAALERLILALARGEASERAAVHCLSEARICLAAARRPGTLGSGGGGSRGGAAPAEDSYRKDGDRNSLTQRKLRELCNLCVAELLYDGYDGISDFVNAAAACRAVNQGKVALLDLLPALLGAVTATEQSQNPRSDRGFDARNGVNTVGRDDAFLSYRGAPNAALEAYQPIQGVIMALLDRPWPPALALPLLGFVGEILPLLGDGSTQNPSVRVSRERFWACAAAGLPEADYAGIFRQLLALAEAEELAGDASVRSDSGNGREEQSPESWLAAARLLYWRVPPRVMPTTEILAEQALRQFPAAAEALLAMLERSVYRRKWSSSGGGQSICWHDVNLLLLLLRESTLQGCCLPLLVGSHRRAFRAEPAIFVAIASACANRRGNIYRGSNSIADESKSYHSDGMIVSQRLVWNAITLGESPPAGGSSSSSSGTYSSSHLPEQDSRSLYNNSGSGDSDGASSGDGAGASGASSSSGSGGDSGGDGGSGEAIQQARRFTTDSAGHAESWRLCARRSSIPWQGAAGAAQRSSQLLALACRWLDSGSGGGSSGTSISSLHSWGAGSKRKRGSNSTYNIFAAAAMAEFNSEERGCFAVLPAAAAVILALFAAAPAARQAVLRAVMDGVFEGGGDGSRNLAFGAKGAGGQAAEAARLRYLCVLRTLVATEAQFDILQPHASVLTDSLSRLTLLPSWAGAEAATALLPLADASEAAAAALVNFCRKCLLRGEPRARLLAVHVAAAMLGRGSSSDSYEDVVGSGGSGGGGCGGGQLACPRRLQDIAAVLCRGLASGLQAGVRMYAYHRLCVEFRPPRRFHYAGVGNPASGSPENGSSCDGEANSSIGGGDKSSCSSGAETVAIIRRRLLRYFAAEACVTEEDSASWYNDPVVLPKEAGDNRGGNGSNGRGSGKARQPARGNGLRFLPLRVLEGRVVLSGSVMGASKRQGAISSLSRRPTASDSLVQAAAEERSGGAALRTASARDAPGHLLKCVWRLEATEQHTAALAATVCSAGGSSYGLCGRAAAQSCFGGADARDCRSADAEERVAGGNRDSPLEAAAAVVRFLARGADCRLAVAVRPRGAETSASTVTSNHVSVSDTYGGGCEADNCDGELPQCDPRIVSPLCAASLVLTLCESLLACLLTDAAYGGARCAAAATAATPCVVSDATAGAAEAGAATTAYPVAAANAGTAAAGFRPSGGLRHNVFEAFVTETGARGGAGTAGTAAVTSACQTAGLTDNVFHGAREIFAVIAAAAHAARGFAQAMGRIQGFGAEERPRGVAEAAAAKPVAELVSGLPALWLGMTQGLETARAPGVLCWRSALAFAKEFVRRASKSGSTGASESGSIGSVRQETEKKRHGAASMPLRLDSALALGLAYCATVLRGAASAVWAARTVFERGSSSVSSGKSSGFIFKLVTPLAAEYLTAENLREVFGCLWRLYGVVCEMAAAEAALADSQRAAAIARASSSSARRRGSPEYVPYHRVRQASAEQLGGRKDVFQNRAAGGENDNSFSGQRNDSRHRGMAAAFLGNLSPQWLEAIGPERAALLAEAAEPAAHTKSKSDAKQQRQQPAEWSAQAADAADLVREEDAFALKTALLQALLASKQALYSVGSGGGWGDRLGSYGCRSRGSGASAGSDGGDAAPGNSSSSSEQSRRAAAAAAIAAAAAASLGSGQLAAVEAAAAAAAHPGDRVVEEMMASSVLLPVAAGAAAAEWAQCLRFCRDLRSGLRDQLSVKLVQAYLDAIDLAGAEAIALEVRADTTVERAAYHSSVGYGCGGGWESLSAAAESSPADVSGSSSSSETPGEVLLSILKEHCISQMTLFRRLINGALRFHPKAAAAAPVFASYRGRSRVSAQLRAAQTVLESCEQWQARTNGEETSSESSGNGGGSSGGGSCGRSISNSVNQPVAKRGPSSDTVDTRGRRLREESCHGGTDLAAAKLAICAPLRFANKGHCAAAVVSVLGACENWLCEDSAAAQQGDGGIWKGRCAAEDIAVILLRLFRPSAEQQSPQRRKKAGQQDKDANKASEKDTLLSLLPPAGKAKIAAVLIRLTGTTRAAGATLPIIFKTALARAAPCVDFLGRDEGSADEKISANGPGADSGGSGSSISSDSMNRSCDDGCSSSSCHHSSKVWPLLERPLLALLAHLGAVGQALDTCVAGWLESQWRRGGGVQSTAKWVSTLVYRLERRDIEVQTAAANARAFLSSCEASGSGESAGGQGGDKESEDCYREGARRAAGGSGGKVGRNQTDRNDSGAVGAAADEDAAAPARRTSHATAAVATHRRLTRSAVALLQAASSSGSSSGSSSNEGGDVARRGRAVSRSILRDDDRGIPRGRSQGHGGGADHIGRGNNALAEQRDRKRRITQQGRGDATRRGRWSTSRTIINSDSEEGSCSVEGPGRPASTASTASTEPEAMPKLTVAAGSGGKNGGNSGGGESLVDPSAGAGYPLLRAAGVAAMGSSGVAEIVTPSCPKVRAIVLLRRFVADAAAAAVASPAGVSGWSGAAADAGTQAARWRERGGAAYYATEVRRTGGRRATDDVRAEISRRQVKRRRLRSRNSVIDRWLGDEGGGGGRRNADLYVDLEDFIEE